MIRFDKILCRATTPLTKGFESPQVAIEAANEKFQKDGAQNCVIIKDPFSTTIEEILALGKDAWIEDNDEAGDDTIVVRIGNSEQTALTYDQLMAALRE